MEMQWRSEGKAQVSDHTLGKYFLMKASSRPHKPPPWLNLFAFGAYLLSGKQAQSFQALA